MATLKNSALTKLCTLIKSAIPTKTSDIQNDSHFVVDSNYVHTDNNYSNTDKNKLDNIEANAEVNIQSNWNTTDESDDSFILNKPTSLSAFTNDSGFIDNTTTNLTNYYLKTETYSKTEVNTMISGISTLNILVVETLPTSNISTSTIYLVRKAVTETENIYTEYININGDVS